MKIRDGLMIVGAAMLGALIMAAPPAKRLEGFSIDVLHLLRHQLFDAGPVAPDKGAVVIGIDEETYRTPPFSGLPKVMWTPEIARVLNAVVNAGAAVVGFDVIFPTSVEKHIRGFDRDFLLALRAAARKRAVILSKVQHSDKPIAPHPTQSFAVGHSRSIRAVNVTEDPDGIIRRVPLFFDAVNRDGTPRREPSFSLEIAGRAAGVAAIIDKSGAVRLGEREIVGSRSNNLGIDFDTANGAVPTYSLADLHACAAAGNAEYFRQNFSGRPVLLGVVVDVEDRKLTSARFATGGILNSAAARCAGTGKPARSGARDSLPGVFIHASAVNNMLGGRGLREFGDMAYAAWSLPLALFAALMVMVFRPVSAAVVVLLGALCWTVLAAALFRDGLVLPLVDPLLVAGIAFGVMLAHRYFVSDRDKRYLRNAFTYYLAPSVIDQMVDSERPPELGGESRDITVLFSDIVGFTPISEALSPRQLVTFLNQYLSAMTDIIEAHGGFVDKYIGDAIVAVFGAPLDDDDHALHAVQAALACNRRLAGMGAEFGVENLPVIDARIGVNSGRALVGNIGSVNRFNYTVIGDNVNLAARLEGANKAYKSRILVGQSTAEACDGGIAFRELDRIRVVGRDEPVSIFEPIGNADEIVNAKRVKLEAFEHALQVYRSREFAEAAMLFENLADEGDGVAGAMADRARRLNEDPPEEGWDGVTNLDSK